jgi:hypothetical protein
VRVALAKTSSGRIIPATEEDRTKLRAWRPGEVVVVKATRPRNVDHHRKFMACVQFVAERHPDWRKYHTIEPLLFAIKDATGHYSVYTVESTGEIIRIPKSIAFDEMDEADFIAWSARAKTVLLALMDDWPERTKARYSEELDEWVHWCLH